MTDPAKAESKPEKLKMHTPDLVSANLAWVAERFPGCITESRNDKGELVRAVDFDLLRQELSTEIVEGPQERYHLNWPGKREALLAANAPIAKTLRPCREESVDFDTTRNLFIEGDNLDALKLLQETYLNKIQAIYIDPPYNTGHDFLYEDDFAETASGYLHQSNQQDDSGQRLVANPETKGRFHSDWLTMMLPRLKLARTLLSNDGLVFISIDRNEVATLLQLCREVFGEQNFIANIAWVSNLKGRQISDAGPVGTHEYILCFARDASCLSQFRGSGKLLRKLMPSVYKGAAYEVKHDAKGPYVTKNELYNTNSKFNEVTAPTMVFVIHHNFDTGETRVSDIDASEPISGFVTIMPHRNAKPGLKYHAWRWSRKKILEESEELEFVRNGDSARVYTKIRDTDGMALKDVILGISTVDGQADLKALDLDGTFDTPKPVELLKVLLATSTRRDAIVLDFFAGSGATAQAVMETNVADGGSRQFIMVQLPAALDASNPYHRFTAGWCDEHGLPRSLAEPAKQRLRRAGERTATGRTPSGGLPDTGFRVLKVDSSNMKEVFCRPDETTPALLGGYVDNIKDDRTDEDLLFQVLLDWGVDLSLPISTETICGKTVYFVDTNALAACFETGITEDFVKELAGRKPLRVVFRDSGYSGDDVKINVEQIFKQLSPGTDVKTL